MIPENNTESQRLQKRRNRRKDGSFDRNLMVIILYVHTAISDRYLTSCSLSTELDRAVRSRQM